MSALAARACEPCRGNVPALAAGRADELLAELDPAWQLVDGHHLSREFSFADFQTALDYVNRLGAIAEAEGHHPDLLLRWGSVRVDIWTHKIDGLTESDFILAAKADVAHEAP